MSKFWKNLKYLAPIFFLITFFGLIVRYSNQPIRPNSQDKTFVAGIKSFYFGPENNLQIGSDEQKNAFLDILTAQSLFIYDATNNKVVATKNQNDKIPVASTLKILTAIVVLDNSPLESVFTVSAKAAAVGEDSMFLEENEKLTVEELLYGLMLPSGNDAAITLAEGVADAEEEFVKLLNQKAVKIGMTDSFFVNSTGLEGDGNDYSTAKDMNLLANYAWNNYPKLKKIVGTYNYQIEANNFHKFYDLYNETNLLTTYIGVKGFKPGFTPKAGYCLITVAEVNDHEIFITMLNSQNRREEMRQILDYLQTIIL